MKTKRTVWTVVKTLVIAAVAVLFIIPLIWMILSSLKSANEVFAVDFHWLPSEFRWKNYVDVWTNEEVSLLRAYLNSLFIVVVATIGQLVIASYAAFAFAKIRFKGKNFIFMLFLSSMMIPSQVTIIPRWMLFKTLGLYDRLWAIILPSWFGATAIFMLRQFYMGLPNELMEAAKIDGAGYLRIFHTIMLPLTKPAMVSLIVLSFIANWNEYLSPLIFLVSKSKYTVAQAIRWYLLDNLSRYDLTMACATSAIIPVIILFVCCQKYFVEGIATSGLKG